MIKANDKTNEILKEKEKYKNQIIKIYSFISYFLSILYGTILAIGNLLFENKAYVGVILCIAIGIIIAILTYFQTPVEGCQKTNFQKYSYRCLKK